MSLTKFGDIKERLERLESPLPVLAWGVWGHDEAMEAGGREFEPQPGR